MVIMHYIKSLCHNVIFPVYTDTYCVHSASSIYMIYFGLFCLCSTQSIEFIIHVCISMTFYLASTCSFNLYSNITGSLNLVLPFWMS